MFKANRHKLNKENQLHIRRIIFDLPLNDIYRCLKTQTG